MSLRVYTGSYVGNGSDSGTTYVEGVPFSSKFVWVVSPAGSSTYGATYNPYFMTNVSLSTLGSHAFQSGEAWVLNTQSRDEFNGISSNGFSIRNEGSAAYKYMHGSGSVYPFLCLGGDDVITGSYVGNGTDNRSITGIFPFQPVFILLFSATSGNVPFMKFNSAGTETDTTHYTNSGANSVDVIQKILPTGMEVGGSSGGNTNGVTYFYMAIKASNQVVQGSYAGNATDPTHISLGGQFQANALFVKSRSAYNFSYTQNPGMSESGNTKYYRSLGYTTNSHIKSLNVGSFTLGGHGDTNASSVTYDYLALTRYVGPQGITLHGVTENYDIDTVDGVDITNIDVINTIT